MFTAWRAAATTTAQRADESSSAFFALSSVSVMPSKGTVPSMNADTGIDDQRARRACVTVMSVSRTRLRWDGHGATVCAVAAVPVTIKVEAAEHAARTSSEGIPSEMIMVTSSDPGARHPTEPVTTSNRPFSSVDSVSYTHLTLPTIYS